MKDKDEKPFSCKPGEYFDKDCNGCTCGPTGTYAKCDGFICDPVNKSLKAKEPKNCKPGGTYSDGCNQCSCDGGCTLMMCYKFIGEKPENIKRKN